MDENIDIASELLAEGRVHLASDNFKSACEVLEEACQLMTDKYGEMSKELAEPCYLYGKSLLGLARSESSVLGGGVAIPQEAEGSDSSDEEDENKEEPTESKGLNLEPDVAPPTSTEEEVKEEENGKEEIKDEESKEEVSTLQLAWEILEVSRLICQKDESMENQLLLAEICLSLGEVGLESEQYGQAIDDFMTCLQLREALLPPDSRLLAEVHYQLGFSYSLMKRPNDSIAEYQQAIQVLELRVEKLSMDSETATDERERQKLLTERDNIKELLPEIELKIVDAEELHKMQEKELMDSNEQDHVSSSDDITEVAPITSTGNNVTSSDSIVSDITHLVRKKQPLNNGNHSEEVSTRKRANEDFSGEDELVPPKKSCSSIEADSTTAESIIEQ